MARITWLQIFATVFQLITSTSETSTGTCTEDNNVGIRNELKVIPDAQMNASSNNGSNFRPKFGRLEGSSAWCPNSSDANSYLEIDLGQKYDICGVEVQGLPGANERTNFTLSYSDDDGSTFMDIQRFDGSAADGNERDFHELPSTITTQFIRFKPVSTSICLRVEAYGTPEGVTITCNENDIRVQIDRSVNNTLDPNDLSLINSTCQATLADPSFIYFDITLGTCETRVVISTDGVNSFYRNTISSSDNTTKFEIICSKVRESTFLGGGSGEFSFVMEIFTDENFTTLATNTISLGTELHFRIKVDTFGIDTEVHLINCRATNSSDPDDQAAEVYQIIEKGCNVASASIVTDYDCAKTSNTQTFDLFVFRFTGSSAGDLIYFHCQAAVCLRSNTDSLCRTQCNDCPGGKRKKRNLGDHSRNDLAEENLVLGPYHIIDNDDDNDPVVDGRTKGEDPSEAIEDSKNFPVAMVIIVCLGSLAAIAIAIAFFVTLRLSQSSRGPAVKDVTVELVRDNLAFDELDVKALTQMKT